MITHIPIHFTNKKKMNLHFKLMKDEEIVGRVFYSLSADRKIWVILETLSYATYHAIKIW